MGKGDKRTRRGKIFKRSYGKSRLQIKKVKNVKPGTAKKESPKKAAK